MSTRMCLVTLGCPKNQVDSEVMLGLLEEQGFEIVAEPEQADVLLVNTCAFIEDAAKESIDQILELAELKRDGRASRLVVAGCLAERYGGDLLTEIPEVDALIGPGQISRLPGLLGDLDRGRSGQIWTGSFENVELPVSRVPTGAPHTAYLKISEGCDHRCAFCLIPKLRGPQRSRLPESILAEARDLADRGVREVVLVAQDTTAYGRDLSGEISLAGLLRAMEDLAEGPEWIRVLYTHPRYWTEELITTFAGGHRLLPYVDMPIQHASDDMLRAMGRGHSRADLESLLAALRGKIPRIVIRTTILVGHPGETEADVEELERLLTEFPFDRLGAFAYSPASGTRSATFDRQVSPDEAGRRRERILELQRKQAVLLQKRRKGQELRLLVEGVNPEKGFAVTRSFGEAPEIDGSVYLRAPEQIQRAEIEPGDFVWGRVIGAGAYDLAAVPLVR